MLLLAKEGVTIRNILLLQLVGLLIISLLLAIKSPYWGLAGFAGGLALYLPNVIFAWITQNKENPLGAGTGIFFIGWFIKTVMTVVLLVISISVFKDAFIPLGIVCLSMVLIHQLAPLIIDRYCNYIKSLKG